MKAPAFAYARARTLDEVFDLLHRHGDDAKILAGGQSLLPAVNMRLAQPAVLIDINGLPGLAEVEEHAATLRVGALVRHAALARSAPVAAHLPLIYQAMPHVAHAAIRNRGTFGGSIVFADPAAELPACALALDATLVLASRTGERRCAARDFFRGLYEIDLAPGEVLVAAEFSKRDPRERCTFRELTRRHGDYAIVGVAARARVEDGCFAHVRLTFFGVGATPVIASSAAAALDGKPFTRENVAAAQAAVADDLVPTADLYHSAATKLHLARVLAGRALADLAVEPAA